MDSESMLPRLALALGIGLLVGLERGWRTRGEEGGSRAAGIRTFALTGLMGGVVGAIADGFGAIGGGIAVGIAFAAYAGVIGAFSIEENRAEKTFSATTAVAGMVTFALGAYAALGDVRLAAAAAVATAILLAAREQLHGWVAKITAAELRSGLILLTMTFVALPVMPDEAIGPYGGVNPRDVWLIAIVLAAVSFLGYAAVKGMGSGRGILLAAAAGGLVSSTAVTLTYAQRARAGEGAPRLLAAGAALATAISLLRVLGIVAVLKPDLLARVAPSLLGAIAVAAGFSIVWARLSLAAGKDEPPTSLANPFSLRSVLGFALILATIMVASRAVGDAFGATGVVVGAAVVGLADVDAITISLARLPAASVGEEHAALAILAASGANTSSKLAMGVAVGRGSFAAMLTAMTAGCFVVALVLWGATPMPTRL